MPAPNINQKIHSNAIKASVNLARYEASAKAKVAQQLERLRKDLVAEIMDKALKKTAFNEARVKQLLAVTNKAISSGYAGIAADQEVQLYDLMKVQVGVSKAIVNDAVGFSLLDTVFTDTQLQRLASNVLIQGAPSAEWWARAGKATTEKFADNIRQGMLAGETMDEIVARVQGTGGVMYASTRQAEALVRTSVQTAANDIRQEVFKENNDLFDGIQWVSTLDGRTTEVCQALDGLIWDNNLEPVGHDRTFPGPTAHWGCRSTQVPVLKKWQDLIEDKKLAEALDEYEKKVPGTRASIDGQVSDKMNYEDWLKTRPEAEQIDILGPGKWQLWKDDKLYWTEMIDQKGRPLTLKELAMQYNLEGSVGAASVKSLVATADAVADAKAATQSAISTAISSAVTTEKALGTTAYVKQLVKEGFDTPTILSMVKAQYPDAKTSAGMVATVKSKLKAEMSKSVVAAVDTAKAVAATEVAAAVAKAAQDVLAAEAKAAEKLAQSNAAQVAAAKTGAKTEAALAKQYYAEQNYVMAQKHATAWAAHADYLYASAAEAGLPSASLMMGFATDANAFMMKVDKASKAQAMAALDKVEHKKVANKQFELGGQQAFTASQAELGGDVSFAKSSADNAVDYYNKALTNATKAGDAELVSVIQTELKAIQLFLADLADTLGDLADELPAVKYNAVTISEMTKKNIDITLIKAQDMLSQGKFSSATQYAQETQAMLKDVISTITYKGGDASYYENQLAAVLDVLKYAKASVKIDLHETTATVTTAVKVKPTIEVTGMTSYMKALLLEGKTPAQIVQLVKEKYPDAKPSASMVSVVKSKMKKMGMWDAAPVGVPLTEAQAAALATKEAVQYVHASGSFSAITGDRAVQLMRDYLALFNSSKATGKERLEEAERAALRSYTASSTMMNNELRTGRKLSSSTIAAQRGLWRNGLDQNTLLYRGVRSDFAKTYTQIATKQGLQNLVNMSIDDAAFLSTSISRNVADRWSGSDGMLIEIKAPRGTPGAYVKPISLWPSENEWLLPPGARLHIIGAEWITASYGGRKLKVVVEIYYPKGKPR